MVAGTSIGSFVGAVYCEDRESRSVETRCRDWAKRMAGVANKILDLTYPATSMFTGNFIVIISFTTSNLYTIKFQIILYQNRVIVVASP